MPEFYSCIVAARDSIYRSARDDVKQGQENGNGPQTPKGQEMEPVFLQDISDLWRQASIGPGQGELQIAFHGLYDQAGLDLLEAQPPGQLWILWVGNQDGSPKGVTLTYDEDGNEIVTGTADYPGADTLPGSGPITRAEALLETIPDIVVYDENGNEVSRDRPVSTSETHTFWGWGFRREDLA